MRHKVFFPTQATFWAPPESEEHVVLRDPDGELVERARGGDGTAMRQLYQSHVALVYGYALRSTGDTQHAEDIAQDVFVRAFRSLDSFRGRSKFKTWLMTIAVNCTRSQLKKQAANDTDSLDETHLAVVPADSTRWLKDKLNAALARLPLGYREVLLMHDLLGMKHNEIAELRNCSVGTCKSQLHKGRARLKTELEGSRGID